jgi:sodium-dependent dicarboxylate transporter 2/3/5
MALPMSTPPNAMAHGTGEVTSRDFAQTGGLIGIAGVVLIVSLAVAWSRLAQ